MLKEKSLVVTFWSSSLAWSLAGRDTLVIQAEREIAVGDILQVGDIKVEITKAVPLEDFGRFNWEVCIRGDVSKLRGRLTYIVG